VACPLAGRPMVENGFALFEKGRPASGHAT